MIRCQGRCIRFVARVAAYDSLPGSLHTIRCQGRCIRFVARVTAYDSLPGSRRTIRCQGHGGRRSMIDTTHTFLPLPRRKHVARVSPSAQQRLAADAAGASRDLVLLYHAVSCRRSSRSTRPPAAPLKPGVGRHLNPKCPCRTVRKDARSQRRIKAIHLANKYRTSTRKYRCKRKIYTPRQQIPDINEKIRYTTSIRFIENTYE